MTFKQYYLGCLSHASYLIGDGGEAVVVDPQRDVDQYVADARAAGLAIVGVIETHLHADFVSGHRELAARTGAKIYVGHRAGVEFEHVAMREGGELRLGAIRLRFLETPGHTPESVSIVVEAPGAPPRVLTGDTLFIGDVGRPDLIGARGHSAEEMASTLYDSLRTKLMTLPDATEVYPAHGAGSACGKNLSSELSSTIGAQKRVNWALQPMAREAFVKDLIDDLPPPPRYFAHDVEENRRGPRPLDSLPPAPALTAAEVARLLDGGGVALDVRDATAYGHGHVPGAINLGLAGGFAPWAGALLPVDASIVLVADDARQVAEATTRLARVGIEGVSGWLDGGVGAWLADGRTPEALPQVTVDELRDRLAGATVIDVRRASEHAAGHIPGAVSVPLDQVADAALPAADALYVVCAAGYRSSAAASLLLRRGVRGVINVVGGTSAWKAAGLPLERAAADPAV
jgi:glyoxylase-like metal-dependent hydrolase (beta-lactamase superfamily II)/rhodanese-related sulfurtransferase